MIKEYLLGELDFPNVLQELKALLDPEAAEELHISHVKKLIENSTQELNLIKAQETSFEIHGTEGQWLQAGHVFIALKSK